MIKINYKSDFKINESSETVAMEVPFVFSYYVFDNKKYVVSFDGHSYVNCERKEDGSLDVIFNQPNFGIGRLKVERKYAVDDKAFADGVFDVVTVDKTDVFITSGQTFETYVKTLVVPPYIKGDKGDPMTWETMTEKERGELVKDIAEAIDPEMVMTENEKSRQEAEQSRQTAEQQRSTTFNTLKGEMQSAITAGNAAAGNAQKVVDEYDTKVAEQDSKLSELGSKSDEFNPNIFFYSNNKRVIHTGELEAYSGFLVTPEIPCKEGDIIDWYSGKQEADYTSSLVIYDENGGKLSYISIGTGTERSITCPEGSSYLKATILKEALNGWVKVNGIHEFTYNRGSIAYSEMLDKYIESKLIIDSNDAIFVPYYGKYVDITTSTITIPKNSRIYYGESKVFVLTEDVIIPRNTQQNTEIVLFNSNDKTFRCYTSEVAESNIPTNEHFLFSVKKGLDGCSLSSTYVRYEGKDKYVIHDDLKDYEALKEVVRIGDIIFDNNIQYTGATELGYEYVTDDDWFVTYRIPCKVGDKVDWYSGYTTANYRICMCVIDTHGNRVSYNSVGTGVERTLTCPEGSEYIIASIYKPAKSGYVKVNGEFVFVDDGTISYFTDSVAFVVKKELSESNLDGTDKNLQGLMYNALKVFGINSTSVNNNNIVSLLHFSDLHGSKRKLQRIVDFVKGNSNLITDAIHSGDTTAAYYSDTNVWNNVVGAEYIMNSIGNHDCWIEGQTWPYPYSATSEQVFKTIMVGNDSSNPFIDKWGVQYEENKCYYFKDYSNANVRLIVLDSLHYDEEHHSWFVEKLNEALTQDLHIVCVTHYQCITGQEKIELGGWNSIKYNLGRKTPTPDSQIDHRLDERPYLAVDNFITNGGKFICWLSGHTHFDMVGFVNDHTNQLSVVVDTSADYDVYVEEDRTNGTKNEDAFNIAAVNTADGILRIVRVGCDCDMWLRSKKTICYDYINKKIISFS